MIKNDARRVQNGYGGKVKVTTLYLATPSELETKLLQTGDISNAVKPSLKALSMLNGIILKKDKQDWKPFVDIIVKHVSSSLSWRVTSRSHHCCANTAYNSARVSTRKGEVQPATHVVAID